MPFTCISSWLDQQDALARKYGLDAQLNCMNYWYLCKESTGEGSEGGKRRWVLADLGREEIRGLQNERGEQQMGRGAWQGLVDEVSFCGSVTVDAS